MRGASAGTRCPASAAPHPSPFYRKRVSRRGRGIEAVIRIIKVIELLITQKELTGNLLMNRIPELYGYKEVPSGNKPEECPEASGAADLAVHKVILDQTPDLTVKHTVKLGDQDDIITEMAVLGKKREP